MSDQAERGFDLGACLSGVMAAILILIGGGLLVGLGLYMGALPFGWTARLVLAIQIAAALLAGIRVGRRVTGSGLIHGLVTGALLVATLGVVDVMRSAPPGMADLLRSGSLMLLASTGGGILGINFAR